MLHFNGYSYCSCFYIFSSEYNGEYMNIVGMLVSNPNFFNWHTSEEVNSVVAILECLSSKIKQYVEIYGPLIHSCLEERFNAKQTVFVLQNGSLRLTGKAHQLDEDILQIIGCMDLIKSVLLTDEFKDMDG